MFWQRFKTKLHHWWAGFDRANKRRLTFLLFVVIAMFIALSVIVRFFPFELAAAQQATIIFLLNTALFFLTLKPYARLSGAILVFLTCIVVIVSTYYWLLGEAFI